MKSIKVRFSPESSWYLHLGHLKNIAFNNRVSKIYNGVVILRIDDTNSYKNKKIYKSSIIKNLGLLNKFLIINFNKKISYSSYKFHKIYQYLEFLLKWKIKNKILKFFFLKNLRNLKNGFLKEKKTVKSIFKKNIYRAKYNKHYKSFWCWFIYPLYDYSHNIFDKIDSVKYSICGYEFFKNKSIYNLFVNLFYKLNKPIQFELRNFKIKNNLFSKTLLRRFKNYYIKNSKAENLNLLKNILKKDSKIITFLKNFKKNNKENKNFIRFLFLKIKNFSKKKIIELQKDLFLENILLVNRKIFIKKKKQKIKIINFKRKLHLKNTNYYVYCYKMIIKNKKFKNLLCKIYKKKMFFLKYYIKIDYLKLNYINVQKKNIYKSLLKSGKISDKKEKKILFLSKLSKNKLLNINTVKLKKSKIFI